MTTRLCLTHRLFLTTRTGVRVRTTGSERSSPSRREESLWAERKLRLQSLFLWSHWLEAAALPFDLQVRLGAWGEQQSQSDQLAGKVSCSAGIC